MNRRQARRPRPVARRINPYAIESLEPRMLLAAYLWNNAAGGNWNDPANWTPNGIPGATANDTATIDLPGTYTVTLAGTARSIDFFTLGGVSGAQTLAMSTNLTLAMASTVNANGVFSQSAGTLDGGGDLTVSGALAWTGGSSTMSGSGETIIASSASLNISGFGTKSIARALQNDGTATWSPVGGAVLSIVASGMLLNNGSLNVSVPLASNAFVLVYGPTGEFINSGSFTLSGPFNSELSIGRDGPAGAEFSNAGPVSISGALSLWDSMGITRVPFLSAQMED